MIVFYESFTLHPIATSQKCSCLILRRHAGSLFNCRHLLFSIDSLLMNFARWIGFQSHAKWVSFSMEFSGRAKLAFCRFTLSYNCHIYRAVLSLCHWFHWSCKHLLAVDVVAWSHCHPLLKLIWLSCLARNSSVILEVRSSWKTLSCWGAQNYERYSRAQYQKAHAFYCKAKRYLINVLLEESSWLIPRFLQKSQSLVVVCYLI